MTNKVLDFIARRFSQNCHWLDGNCYYFAQILKSRFPKGDIYYDVIWGHFLFKLDDVYYDWSGIAQKVRTPIKWDTFETEYDKLQYGQIVKACIM